MAFDWKFLFLSLTGRIGRMTFWLASVGLIVGSALAFLLVMVLGHLSGAGEGPLGYFFLALILLIVAAMLMGSIAVAVKRLHDRDKSGWWLFLYYGVSFAGMAIEKSGLGGTPEAPSTLSLAVGIAGLVVFVWFLVELGFLKGTTGPNQYGEDPLRG